MPDNGLHSAEFKQKARGYSGRSSEPLVIYIFFRAESRGDRLLLKFLVEVPKNGHFFKILGQNLTKFQKSFFCLGGLYAGAIIPKKFSFLDLPWKFHQNPCSRSRDIACFWHSELSKKSTFRLRTHISLRVFVPNLLFKELKIVHLGNLFPLVGCCGPNGSGDMAAQSRVSSHWEPLGLFFLKNHRKIKKNFPPLLEYLPDAWP